MGEEGEDDPDVQAAADRVAREVDKAKSAADSVAQVAALSRSLSGKGAAAEKPAPVGLAGATPPRRPGAAALAASPSRRSNTVRSPAAFIATSVTRGALSTKPRRS